MKDFVNSCVSISIGLLPFVITVDILFTANYSVVDPEVSKTSGFDVQFNGNY